MEEKEKAKRILTNWKKDFLYPLITAIILVILLNAFILQLFWIPSPSMEPTLLVGDRIVVTKYSYWFKEPQRQDIIVFKYPNDTSINYVKRIIGLAGETVTIKDSKVYINGALLEEVYIPQELKYENYGPVVVPEDNYLVLGDNRSGSEDSRVWGYLSRELIVGKVQYRYWPLSRLAPL